jgi:glucose/arabinose dehydrogenase
MQPTHRGHPSSRYRLRFEFLEQRLCLSVPFVATQPGYVIETVAEGLQLPVNIAFVPDPGPAASDALYYVAELYGNVKVVTNDGTVSDYATGLLNYNPTGNFPGSGEQGLAGIAVDPTTGDVYVTRVASLIPFDDNAPHHPQVVRLSSDDGGLTASSVDVILDMVGETQGQSHQISNITVGPDAKLYVHNGDGFDASTAQNLSSYRGKVLRLNPDGSAPNDNPFYNALDGIDSVDYVYAYGLRNPFGGAWRSSDGMHYEVENGPSIDRFAKIERGENYLWDGSNASMLQKAIYNWIPAHAPVNITFIQPETFGGSQFPKEWMDVAFVSESGPTYAEGPQERGKRIVTFELDANGDLVRGPLPFVEYVGSGRATVVGLAAGPDGLYFTELYRDEGAVSPIDPGARVLRVRYQPVRTGDFNGDGMFDCADVDALVAEIAAGTNASHFDLTADGVVDEADLDYWLAEAGDANLPSQNPYLRGDANLDGVVDGLDYIAWNENKFTSGTGWCGGDFNADGLADGLDFILWNANKFQSSFFVADPGREVDGSVAQHKDRLVPNEETVMFQATDVALMAFRPFEPGRPLGRAAAHRIALPEDVSRELNLNVMESVPFDPIAPNTWVSLERASRRVLPTG